MSGASSSPNKMAAQKRVREPTGSNGPASNDNSGNGGGGIAAGESRAGAGMGLWRPDALPAPPLSGDVLSPVHIGLSASYGGEPTDAGVRIRGAMPSRPYSALLPQTASPWAAIGVASPGAPGSVPQKVLRTVGSGAGMHPANTGSVSVGSLPLPPQQQHQQSLPAEGGQGPSPSLSLRSVYGSNQAEQRGSGMLPASSQPTGGGNGVGSPTAASPSQKAPAPCTHAPGAASTSAPSSSASSAFSSSSGSTSSDDNSDTNENTEHGMREDRLKRYPRFTTEYAAKCNGDLVPFLRAIPVPVGGTAPHLDPMATHQESNHNVYEYAHAFVLYGQYVYRRTLGKGTYSKVVLAEELGPSPVEQRQQLVSAATDAAGIRDGHSSCSAGSAFGAGAMVALKVFRDSEVYREACWDEYTILSALCTPMAGGSSSNATGNHHKYGNNNRLANGMQFGVTARTAAAKVGLMDYYGNVGRFMTPSDYIPHPLHPAVVYPVMGPSLLHVARGIKKASKEALAAVKRSHSTPPSPPSARSNPHTAGGGMGRGGNDGNGGGGVGGAAAEEKAVPSPVHGAKNDRRLWLRGLPIPLLKVVLYQILLFLRFVHARGLVHTDLKPENILFETNICLPTPVDICYKHVDRSAASMTGRTAAAANSLEGRKILNDTQKLASAITRGNSMAKPFPASPIPSEGSGANVWKAPPAPRELIYGHTVTVPMPLLNSIRVVDLGAAQFLSSFTHKSHIDGATPVSYDPIQTSHYRSPETLMGTGWNASADIFSLGCIVPELLTGDCLFMPQDTQEHLALMHHIIGPFWRPGAGPQDGAAGLERAFTINARTYGHYFFAETGQLKWPVTEEVFRAHAQEVAMNEENGHGADDDDAEPPLDSFRLTSKEDMLFVYEKPTLDDLLGDQPLLLDLCQRMLRFNPGDRITAAEALEHPFFDAR